MHLVFMICSVNRFNISPNNTLKKGQFWRFPYSLSKQFLLLLFFPQGWKDHHSFAWAPALVVDFIYGPCGLKMPFFKRGIPFAPVSWPPTGGKQGLGLTAGFKSLPPISAQPRGMNTWGKCFTELAKFFKLFSLFLVPSPSFNFIPILTHSHLLRARNQFNVYVV